jgi:hypothetical protein
MKDLLLYIVKNIVDDPDSVSVYEVEKDDATVMENQGGARRYGQGNRPSGPRGEGHPLNHEIGRNAAERRGFGRDNRLKQTAGRGNPPRFVYMKVCEIINRVKDVTLCRTGSYRRGG